MNENRVKQLNSYEYKKGKILYLMSREQRVNSNWSLIYARELSLKYKCELIVCFNLFPSYLNATNRAYDFLLKGLEEVESKLTKLNINFKVILANSRRDLLEFIQREEIGLIVTDFDPLKFKRNFQNEILENINIPFYVVDSHNIVPIWKASSKIEYAAYTIRPKIKKQLHIYLDNFKKIEKQELDIKIEKNDWNKIREFISCNKEVLPIDWISPGEDAAQLILKNFIDNKLDNYNQFKNDPTLDFQSNLSPYLHFGHISSQDIAIQVSRSLRDDLSIEVFLEELIVRKELADNFCYYNENYDNFEGLNDWAKKSLLEHEIDNREYIYSKEEFEEAKTHDNLWNAAQKELLFKGKIHGYMRMYWAKKILEWTKNSKDAIDIAIYLNDKYSIDGRDPNGYVGVLWSIGGVHDRAWFERDIFGKIRYMNYNGCKKKFNVKKYIEMSY